MSGKEKKGNYMKSLKALFFTVILIMLSISAHTKVSISSFKGLKAPKEPYSSIAILVNSQLNSEKRDIENKIINKFSKVSSTKFVGETNILPPVKDYTPEEMRDIFKSNNIQAVMVVSLIGSVNRYANILVPDTTYTRGSYDGKNFNATTTGNRPVITARNFSSHKIQLFDMSQSDFVWSAEIVSSSTRFTKNWTISSAISKLAIELSNDNLIKN